MSNLMQRGASWLLQKLTAAAGQPVTYSRSGSTIELTGFVAMQSYDVIDSAGSTTTIESYEWRFPPGSLAISGEPIEPRSGDVIMRASDGAVFEVVPIVGKPIWEYADEHDVILVVRSKRLKQ